MKTIPMFLFSAVAFLGLPHLVQGQALPFQQSPPPGAPMPALPVPVDATTTTAEVSSAGPIPDGFFMRDGNLYMVRSGTTTRVTGEQVLRIGQNGTVTGFDGRASQLPSGKMITTDGRVIPLDPSLLTTEERARATSTIAGENRSGLAPAGSGQPVLNGNTSTSAQPDGFSQTPDTRGRRSTSSSRGSSSTFVDPLGTGVVVDQQTPNQNAPATGTTGVQQQNAAQPSTTGTGTNSTATPNQRASTGTNVGPNANTSTSTRTATPNQQSSSGISTSGTTTNPNAVRTGTSGTGARSGTSSTGSTSTGTRSTSGGSTSTSGSSSGSTSGSSGTSGTGTSSGGAAGGATVR